MHPIFLQLGAFKIHWYGVCMAVAFLVGLANWVAVGRRDGRDPAFCSDLLFWVMVAGILGGRLAYVLANADYYLGDPLRVFFIWEGGLIFYGGFIGAVTAVILFARRRHIAALDLFDFAFTSLPLSHAIGRLGCFLNGCCFGGLTRTFPPTSWCPGVPELACLSLCRPFSRCNRSREAWGSTSSCFKMSSKRPMRSGWRRRNLRAVLENVSVQTRVKLGMGFSGRL